MSIACAHALKHQVNPSSQTVKYCSDNESIDAEHAPEYGACGPPRQAETVWSVCGLVCLQSELFSSYPKFKRIEFVQPGVGIKYFQHLIAQR